MAQGERMAGTGIRQGLKPPDEEGEYIATLTRSSRLGWAYLEVHHRSAYRDPFVGRDKLVEMVQRKAEQLADEGWEQAGKIKLQGSFAGVWIERKEPVE